MGRKGTDNGGNGEAAGNGSHPADGGPLCALCRRPLGDPSRAERHHLVPRSRGGRQAVLLHAVCHRKIHSLFTEAEIARHYASIDALRAHPEIRKFVRWLAGRPPDLRVRTRAARTKRRRRRMF